MVNPNELLERLEQRDRGGLARLLTLAESDPDAYGPLADRVQALVTGTLRLGVTGPGGVGKSTLIDALAVHFREQGTTLGILATDPTSASTGGALLGDRVRFRGTEPDEGLFLRSVAHHGASGGLGAAVHDQLDLLDAFGFDLLVLEAVGAGQSEVDIGWAADLVVVVFSPDSGDMVQAMKAGLMEVGDVFCINKADLAGAEQAVDTLKVALELQESSSRSGVSGVAPPPVLAVSARDGQGIPELADQLQRRREHLEQAGVLGARKVRRLRERTRLIALRLLEERWLPDHSLEDAVRGSPEASPLALARQLLERALPRESS